MHMDGAVCINEYMYLPILFSFLAVNKYPLDTDDAEENYVWIHSFDSSDSQHAAALSVIMYRPYIPYIY